MGERQGNLMTSLQEYDLEFKPEIIVKDQGMCKLATRVMDSETKKKMDGKRNHLSIYNKFLVFHQLRICVMMIPSTIFSMV